MLDQGAASGAGVPIQRLDRGRNVGRCRIRRPPKPSTKRPATSTAGASSEIVARDPRRGPHAWEAVGAVLPRDRSRRPRCWSSCSAGGGRWFNVGRRHQRPDRARSTPRRSRRPSGCRRTACRRSSRAASAALLRAVEGAEDHPERAVFELRERGLAPRATPWSRSPPAARRPTRSAASRSRTRWARARSRSPAIRRSPLAEAAEIAIVPQVGPEVIAGSTRMKGGLAQKMVLHLALDHRDGAAGLCRREPDDATWRPRRRSCASAPCGS